MLSENEISDLYELSKLVSEKILEIYYEKYEIEIKTDNSPVTIADKKASKIIVDYLEKKYPHWPAISEEGYIPPYHERKSLETFWLIDPIDGTKEFIAKTGEFTVNIALIHKGSPIAGLIYHPLRKVGYVASQNHGAYKLTETGKEKIFYKENDHILKVAGSRSHSSQTFLHFMDFIKKDVSDIKDIEITRLGSSFKFCLIAEGALNVYPRFGRTMEWDTAAGHAICKEAGLNVYQYGSDKELEYNKPSLENPWFIATNKNLLELLKWNQPPFIS